ncbi:class I SAM-dependent methyltransferase [Micromonospora craniellae]|uniref:Methyltransferase domain-containing protein n=1 Tax=Micromonospora craniellae TaxID=2294034 RepID=A0A372G3G1_9ACTN|nr:methyltransferase domain-containing protein [Micromonospora craniellae]QOC92109.1 methyltransferase domain-containing protein [Micromonospora craniellae]RFS47434.1 methyltransferase domain-containing protein [Micromonospora craniellae]
MGDRIDVAEATRAKHETAAVFDRGAATYDRTGVEFFGPMGRELVRRVGLRPGQQVLDVGCGRGAVLLPAAQAVGPTGGVVGIDLAPTMVDLTRADVATAGLAHVRVDVADAEDPPLPEATFDAVLAGLVVFLLPAPLDALRAYRRLLRPTGRIGVTTFAAHDPRFNDALTALARHLPPERRQPPNKGKPEHFATRESTGELLRRAGYHQVTIDDVPFESRFRDIDHFVAWAWSHGARAILERIPPDRLPAALADAAHALSPTGESLQLTTSVRFAIGSRAES